MINKLLLLVSFTFLVSIVNAQYFEGEIIYTNKFTSKTKNFTDAQLAEMIGTKQEYLIKGGSYKSFLNGQSISMQSYDNLTNRVYNRMPKSDTLYWFDASTNTDNVISYEFKKNAGTVLGNKCDVIIMKTKTGTTTMYYSAKYKVDSKLYTNHLYGNWAFYTSKTGALPLKTIVENQKFKMETTAIEIKRIQLGDTYFNIDPNTPLRKG